MIMKDNTKLQSLSDNELLRRLSELLQNSRRVEADLIGHIAEVDRRRLYARHSPSFFELVAELNPRPDVPPTIRKLPERPSQTKASPSDRPQLGPDRVGPISSAESKRTDAEVNTSVKHQQASAPTRPAESTYIDPAGRRCTETKQLEFHHVQPFGRGGDHRPENICLSCRAHNALFAERDYGREVMNRFRSSPSRVSESAAVYTFSNGATLPS